MANAPYYTKTQVDSKIDPLKVDIENVEQDINNINQEVYNLQLEVDGIADGTGGKAYPNLTTAMSVDPIPSNGVVFSIDETNVEEAGIYAYDSSELLGYRYVRTLIKKATVYNSENNIDVITASVVEPRLLTIGAPLFENKNSEIYKGDNISGSPSWDNESSSFSGWGTIVGVLPKFNKITIGLRGWKEDELPTLVRVRIKKDNYQGEVLFDEKFDFLPVGDKMSFETPAIEYGGDLYIEYLTDGRIGIYRGSGVNTNARYSTNKNPDGVTTHDTGQTRKLWVEYSLNGIEFSLTEEGVEYFKSVLPEPTISELNPIIKQKVTEVHQTTTNQTIVYTTSTFSGWGCGVGVVSQPFKGVKLYINAFNPDVLPTQIRVVVRELAYNGNIIADATVPYTGNGFYSVFFDTEVFSEQELWVEYLTDGSVSYMGTPTNLDIGQTPTMRYRTNNSLNPNSTSSNIATSSKRMINYTFLQKISNQYQFTEEAILEIKEALNITVDLPTLLLNKKAYIFPTFEYNIFNKNLAIPKLGMAGNYMFDYEASNGQQMERGYRYKGVAGQSFNVSVKVYSDTENFVEKTQNITVPSSTNGDGVTRKILIIGDSTIDGGDITNPLYDVFSSDVMNIDFVGTRGSAGKKHEGRAGWTINSYYGTGTISYLFNVTGVEINPSIGAVYSHNGVNYTVTEVNITDGDGYFSCTGSAAPLSSGTLTKVSGSGDDTIAFGSTSTINGNPFYNPSTEMFDLAHYLTETSQSLGDNDWIFFQLGINDVFSQTTQVSADTKVNTMLGQLNAIIDNIHDYNSNIRIGIVVTIPPANQDAFAANYNAGQAMEVYRRIGLLTWQKACLENYDDREGERIYLLPAHLNLDRDYNFPTSSQQVNSRNPETVILQSNGVHPNSYGNMQIADVYAGIIKYFE